jgi:hypothetical protein
VEDDLSSTACCEIAGVRWWLGPGITAAGAEPVLVDALRQLAAGARNLKRGRRKQLYRLEPIAADAEYLLKVNRYDSGTGRLRRARRSKARRELANAVAIRARGIDTPLPFAAGERRTAAGLRECYLLIPVVPGARDLAQLWHDAATSPAARRAWQRELGRLARRLHDAGVEQTDFAPNNFLIDPRGGPAILPIDFERTRLRRSVGARPRGRMLAKLDRHLAGANAAARMRFLRAYAPGDPRLARAWWRRASRQVARLAVRDLARLKRTATAEGRNVQTVDWGGWAGWARRDAPERARAEARTTAPPGDGPPRSLGIQLTADATLWRASGTASPREARRLWAVSHLLWARELGPRPVACVSRGDAVQLWLARDASSSTLFQRCDSAEAVRAAAVLFDRLLALGRVDPWLSLRKVALVPRGDGGLRALLLDPTAFRCGRPRRARRGERARNLLARRLGEVRELRGALRGSAP